MKSQNNSKERVEIGMSGKKAQVKALNTAAYFNKGSKMSHKNYLATATIFTMVLFFMTLISSGETAYFFGKDSDQEAIPSVLSDSDLIEYDIELEAERLMKSRRSKKKQKAKRSKRVVLRGPSLIRRSHKAVLVTGEHVEAVLLSGASSGLVKARLTQNLSNLRGSVLLEAGSLLLGVAQNKSQDLERVHVQFTKAIPRGEDTAVMLEATALDLSDKVAGLKAVSAGAKFAKHGKRGVLNFLSGMADTLQNITVEGGVGVKDSSMRNATLSGLSRSTSMEASSFIDDLKTSHQGLSVPSGRKILVMFLKYGGKNNE